MTKEIKLTSRELEVLRYIANGYSAKQIGNQLFINRTTVVTHCENLKEKLSAKNSSELIFIAVKKGII